MRVLVTGASGMLGRAVAHALLTRGDDVTVWQRGPAGLDCREVRGDVADPDIAAGATRGQEAVIHLAAKVDVTGPRAQYRRVNVDGTRTVLDASRRHDVGRFVHVSSPSVAHSGRALIGAAAEPADPHTARGNYARSKAEAERMALAADGAALAVAVIRPHLVWGPGDTQLVARIVARARAGHLVAVGSGAALIDTTYVSNAADAIVAALERCHLVHGRPLVVSNGEPRPVGEVLARVARAAGVELTPRAIPYRLAWAAGAAVDAVWTAWAAWGTPPDPPVTRFLAGQLATAHWFDQRPTQDALDWRPAVGLDEGFDRLAAWYADPANRPARPSRLGPP